jgi:Protein of unknown function (DUF2971)
MTDFKQFPISSREAAVAFPMDMTVMAFLGKHQNIPRYAWFEKGVVYHYTNGIGLKGILGTDRFWATHYSFLNDPTEGQHALSVAREELTRIGSDPALTELTQLTLLELERPGWSDHYVVSFCRDGDLLSQWRGYGDFGGGFALGFNLPELNPHPQIGMLAHVIYDDQEMREVLNVSAAIYKEHIEKFPLRHVDDIAGWWASVIRTLSQTFKHPAYSEEQEMRLIFRRYADCLKHGEHAKQWEAPISYRMRGADMVPYLDAGLEFADENAPKRLPLLEIVLGPGVPPRNLKSVSDYLHSIGRSDVRVRQSGVPFSG